MNDPSASINPETNDPLSFLLESCSGLEDPARLDFNLPEKKDLFWLEICLKNVKLNKTLSGWAELTQGMLNHLGHMLRPPSQPINISTKLSPVTRISINQVNKLK